MRPVKELETLRCHEKSWSRPRPWRTAVTKVLDGVVGDSCEVEMEIEPGTAERSAA